MDKKREIFLKRRRNQLLKENKLSLYDPYPFQVKFHNDREDRVGLTASNQSGKTIAGSVQDSMDLTGRYPDWYKGIKYDKPVHIICGGVTDPKTRDILQKALLGNPVERESSWGTGWIPKDCLDKRRASLKRGVTDAYAHVMVKHHTNGVFDGWSQLTFSSYAAGKEAWMGDTIDIYHGDEECDIDILAQMGRGCIATHGRIRMTFTPENGETDVLEKVREQWSHHEATFADVAGDDCSYEFDDGEVLTLKPVHTIGGRVGHVTEKTMLNLEKDNPPWMMKTRMLGLAMVGEGRVFPYMEDVFKIEPIEFPKHFLYIDAIDFGGLASTSHPTAFVRLAIDPRTDVFYVYDGFRITGQEIKYIAADINSMTKGQNVPVIWPHDGNKTLGQGGATKEQYADFGVNMFNGNGAKSHFTNPPQEGQKEGEGGIQILPGITEMGTRFRDGRLKVFSTVIDFFIEYRKYHMKDGKIVDRHDDFMSATRYAVMSSRHAVSLEVKKIRIHTEHSRNWMSF